MSETVTKPRVNKRPWRYVLVPGRHHALTSYQAQWVAQTLEGTLLDDQGLPIVTNEKTTWVFAVTSANHQATRRNPVPLTQRIAQIELFAKETNINALVVTIPDTPPTSRFAQIVEEHTHNQLGITLIPQNTLVALSTPVRQLWMNEGYRLGGIELDGPKGTPLAWDLVEWAANGRAAAFKRSASTATIDVWERYKVRDQVKSVFQDQVVQTDDGALTDTRNYVTYKDAFEQTAMRKWEEIRDFVKPGRVVDIGCASGQTLIEAGKDPRLVESDLIGIETDRWLHAEALHRVEQGEFPNPSTHFYRRNILNGSIFQPGTVDTTITLALTHEIYSYGNKDLDLDKLTKLIFEHTRSGGVWVNQDLIAPNNPDKAIRLFLSTEDGKERKVLKGTDELGAKDIKKHLSEVSTATLLRQFQYDWDRTHKVTSPVKWMGDSMVETTVGYAMEFLLHKDYLDNWMSEIQEKYTYRTYQTWVKKLEAAGFEILPGSKPYPSEWIIENRFEGHALLIGKKDRPQPWPNTHMLLTCRKP